MGWPLRWELRCEPQTSWFGVSRPCSIRCSRADPTERLAILDKVNYMAKLQRDGRDRLAPARSRRAALPPLLHEAHRPAPRAPAAEALPPPRTPRALWAR